LRRYFLLFLLFALVAGSALALSSKATSTVSRLRVRAHPNVDADIVGYLAKGESVSLIERSTFTAEADGQLSWWYYVATSEGKEGWVFGRYLDTGETPPAPTPAAPKRTGTSVPLSQLDFRVGAVKPETKDVYLHGEPRRGLNYHVLTLQGATLFIGKPGKKSEPDPCGEGALVRWRLKPRENFRREDLPFQPIVVGAGAETPFTPVVKKTGGLDNQTKQAYLLNLQLPADFPRKYVRANAHFAGAASGKERFIVLYESQQMPVVGLTKAVVSVVERAGPSGELTERYTFYKRRQYGDMGLGFGGMMDPTGDGVADVFLVDFGESEGTYLLIEEPGGWRRQEDDIPGPC